MKKKKQKNFPRYPCGGSQISLYGKGSGVFSNEGMLAKTAGSGVSAILAALRSTGTITASTGTLALAFGGTLDGTIGGTGGGAVQLGNAASYVTDGTLAILDGGTGNGLLLVTGAAWTDSGVISSSGHLVLGSSSGTVTFTIAAGGRFSFIGDDAAIVGGGSVSFSNAGRLGKTGGGGTSTIGVGFSNAGTVDAASGTLKLTAAVTGNGRMLIAAGSTLELASGAIAGGNSVAFTGPGATLQIDAAATASLQVSGLGIASRIGLGMAATAVVNGSTLAITQAGGATLTVVSAASLAGLRAATAADGNHGTVVTLYRAATATHAPDPLVFGNLHAGAVASRALTLRNTAASDGHSEKLDASLATAASGFAVAGSITGLAAQANDTTSLTVTLNTATAGNKAGTASLVLFSDGTGVDGLGAGALAPQTVSVTGAVYAYAAPVLSGATVALGAARVGGAALTGSVTLGDGSSVNAWQESLIYRFSTALPAGLTVSNAAGTLAAGKNAMVGVSLSTATAGSYTGIALGRGGKGAVFVSTGAGTSGLADTLLTAPALTVSGQVFAAAVAKLAAASVSFGVVHVGQMVKAATISVSNAATGGLTDLLAAGTVVVTGSYTGKVTESFGGGIAAGAAGSASFALATTAAGVQSGIVTLGFLSHDAALADLALAGRPVTVTGTVDNYATASITVLSGQTITGAGPARRIDLGTLLQNSGNRTIALDVRNSASGLADLLGGSFLLPAGVAGFTAGGFATFSGVAAGKASATGTVTLSTAATGSFSETITLTPTSDNTSSATKLAVQTLTITATIVHPGLTLTPAPTTVTAAQGIETFISGGGALNSRDSLTAAAGTTGNTLVLSGAGVFDLNAPKTLANLQFVTASEGQAADAGGGTVIPAGSQIVFLRDGLNVTLDVAGTVANPANPNPAGITIYGGNDASVLNLGPGSDTVVLGSAAETVNGGGGSALVQATAAQAGARVTGTTARAITLEITTGGIATLNATTTCATVQLDQATNLTLGKLGFITAVGKVAGNTIIAGAAGQTLGGRAGGDTLVGWGAFGDIFQGTAAGLNGDTIQGFGGTDMIHLTNLGTTATLGYTGTATQGVLSLNDGTTGISLTLTGGFSQSGFHLAGDGHAGSFITYA